MKYTVTIINDIDDTLWGISDLLDGRTLKECNDEVIELLNEDLISIIKGAKIEIVKKSKLEYDCDDCKFFPCSAMREVPNFRLERGICGDYTSK